MNYKELKQLAYDCGLGKNFLFDTMNLIRNTEYEIDFLVKAVKNHMKRYSNHTLNQNKGVVKKLNTMIESIAPKKNNTTSKNEDKSLFSIRQMSVKFNLNTSTLYRIFREYPHYTLIPCQRRADGMKTFSLHQIKDAFEIAIHKNLIPTQIEMIKKVYETLPDFSNLGIYPLTNKQLRDVAQKMDFPQITVKQPESFAENNIETIIELQKEANSLLKQLLEIWRK